MTEGWTGVLARRSTHHHCRHAFQYRACCWGRLLPGRVQPSSTSHQLHDMVRTWLCIRVVLCLASVRAPVALEFGKCGCCGFVSLSLLFGILVPWVSNFLPPDAKRLLFSAFWKWGHCLDPSSGFSIPRIRVISGSEGKSAPFSTASFVLRGFFPKPYISTP